MELLRRFVTRGSPELPEAELAQVEGHREGCHVRPELRSSKHFQGLLCRFLNARCQYFHPRALQTKALLPFRLRLKKATSKMIHSYLLDA